MSFPELELTIFSGHREPHTSIGRANYRINAGPIFAKCISVKSCTMYNTLPNLAPTSATFSFIQYGPDESVGLVTVSIEPGSYTGDSLAIALEAAMTVAIAGTTTGIVNIVYDDVKRTLQFTFDAIYSYYTGPELQEFTVMPFSQVINWTYYDSGGTPHVTSSSFTGSGGAPWTVKSYLAYASSVFTTTAASYEAGAIIKLECQTYDPSGPQFVTFSSSIPGSMLLIPGYGTPSGSTWLMRWMGADENLFFGAGPANSYTSSIPFYYDRIDVVQNPMESILNFGIGDTTVNPHDWESGKINLAGDLYLHFRSRILANRNHRTIEDSRDSTFFSMPITSSYTQLQYFEPAQRTWISFDGGIELTDFTIEIYNEFGSPVELSQNYVLELLIKQTDVF